MPEKKKQPKFPGDVKVIKPSANFNKEKAKLEQESETLVDNLLASEWQPSTSRPRSDMLGYFVVLRWYNKQKQWVPLYLSYGAIQNQLNKIFSGKQSSAIGKYLSSFSKEDRKLIWVKWIKDESEDNTCIDMENALRVIALNGKACGAMRLTSAIGYFA
ncbi:hypothetical protein ScPMuIL_007397 [Solemya velum]